jgi:hypothetical protein
MHPVVEFLSTMCEALSSCYGTWNQKVF